MTKSWILIYNQLLVCHAVSGICFHHRSMMKTWILVKVLCKFNHLLLYHALSGILLYHHRSMIILWYKFSVNIKLVPLYGSADRLFGFLEGACLWWFYSMHYFGIRRNFSEFGGDYFTVKMPYAFFNLFRTHQYTWCSTMDSAFLGERHSSRNVTDSIWPFI